MTTPTAKDVDMLIKELVDKFLAWPLPTSVCSDTCVSTPNYPHRVGTNLLTADEAEQMLKHVVGPVCTRLLELEEQINRVTPIKNFSLLDEGIIENAGLYLSNEQWHRLNQEIKELKKLKERAMKLAKIHCEEAISLRDERGALKEQLDALKSQLAISQARCGKLESAEWEVPLCHNCSNVKL